jgi:hypothetical protein
MNKLLWIGLFLLAGLVSCDIRNAKKVKGNGMVKTDERAVSTARNIRIEGDYAVTLVPDSRSFVTIEADDNLLPYIVTRNEDGGTLVIRTQEGFRLQTSRRVNVHIHTDQLLSLNISGSSAVTGEGKFSGGDHLSLDISGSGKVVLAVNTPTVDADISGSGQMTVNGETRLLKLDISGTGNFRGEDLKAEEASVEITGSGDARVFADAKLKADITGSGHVYYKGNASVTTDITGSGAVKQLQ